MPLTEIVFADGDDGLGGGPAYTSDNTGRGSGGSYALSIAFDTDGTEIVSECSVQGELPNEPLAAGSAYPGAHWCRWDGVLSGGAPLLGVDDGTLENCIANYSPLDFGTPFNRRLCVYLALDGNYYAASASGDSIVNSALQNGLSSPLIVASNYEAC